MPTPPPSKSTQCAVLFSPVPLSLVHFLRIEETLCFGIFPPICFLFAKKVGGAGGGQGPASSVPSFTFPCTKLKLKCCGFLQTLNLKQASDPTAFCGTWVLQILYLCLSFGSIRALPFSLRRSALTPRVLIVLVQPICLFISPHLAYKVKVVNFF